MLTIDNTSAVELPVALALIEGHRQAMRIQRWMAPSLAEAEALFAVVSGLVIDDPAVLGVLLDPKGRDGQPIVSLAWRSSDSVIREQVRTALYPVEPMVREVEAALKANAEGPQSKN